MDTIFTVRNEDLHRLNPQEAVEFFRELLWAEGRRIGVRIANVQISTWINIPDGGVDASINDVPAIPVSDLAKEGITSFQIKAGASFEPWQDAQIKKELFGSRPPDKDNLGSGVRNCMDNNGLYALVCFKHDLTPEQYRETKGHLNSYLTQLGYSHPRVEVLSQANIIGMLKIFPSLSLQVNRRGSSRFQTHQSWSKEAEMSKPFTAGPAQEEFISNLRNELHNADEATHIRVWGEPGIGKTRLILEATRLDDLNPLVVYCDAASKFRDSDLMNEILRDDNQFYVILVIDECDPDARSYIWNKLKYCGPRIKLISIYSEYDETAGNIKYLNASPLDREQISQIIQHYEIPKDQADRWEDICGGSPRVAHVIGWNLKNNPEDLLKSPDTVNVWDRYIVGGDNPSSPIVQQRRLVLRYLALFKRFGYRKAVAIESQAIALKIQQADPQITGPRFQEIIQNLRQRKILQGENTLYITPKALHIKLWTDWWETYGHTVSPIQFLNGLSPTLVEWFNEMFRYARGSKTASEIVKQLLAEDGLFKDEN
jgi:hypothetical protein